MSQTEWCLRRQHNLFEISTIIFRFDPQIASNCQKVLGRQMQLEARLFHQVLFFFSNLGVAMAQECGCSFEATLGSIVLNICK